MGMPVSIHLRGPGTRTETVEQEVKDVYADLAWVDRVFSTYRPDSQISRLRRGELTPSGCGPEVREVMALCQDAAERTSGSFSWLLPGDSGDLVVDPTGLVKGWALARAAHRLDRLDGHAYCVNAGGDITVGGRDATQADPRPWRLGIEDPYDRSQVARVVEMRHGGLATSGTAARGPHLVDPVTGEPSRRRGSVSVLGPDIMWADVWATALFVGPDELEGELSTEPGWRVVRL